MIEVEIWSDVVCPFCYIGKRNLEAAIAASGLQGKVKAVYRSFELDPSSEKSQSISIVELLAKKYGRPIDWAQQANLNVEHIGRATGIEINTSKIILTNSFDAHRLIHLALRHHKQSEMVEQLFKAYFTEGKDIGRSEVLEALAGDVSLPPAEVSATLSGAEFQSEVRADELTAQQIGIRGVPFFLFNGEHALSGAQPVEVFAEVLKELAQT